MKPINKSNAISHLEREGIDLSRDYYELGMDAKILLVQMAKVYGYNYKSPKGRSVTYSFWLTLQKHKQKESHNGKQTI